MRSSSSTLPRLVLARAETARAVNQARAVGGHSGIAVGSKDRGIDVVIP